MSTISDSILTSTKKVLGLDESYTAFDVDVTMHINSVFSILHQLGIGPVDGFAIEDATPTWDLFLDDVLPLNTVKSYMYLQVRMLFDPPATSYLQDSMRKQIEELGWRINVYRESLIPVLTPPVDPDYYDPLEGF